MEDSKTKLYQALTILVLIGVVLAGAKVVTEIKGYRFIGGGVAATNTIAVSGEGEVTASPDIATISFSVREEAKKVADAQNKADVKVKAALAAVRKIGIADKDIKTENYSSYPKYEWQEATYSCMSLDCPPPHPGRQVLIGYEVSQSVSLTVRSLDSVNAIIEALGTAGVTDMQGPNFAIDKEDDLKAEARKQAIEKAHTKAEVLARDLGVSLVRVVSFSEGENYPVYTRATMGAEKADISTPSLPEIPQGEQKITSRVTVTYEIR
jgi:hypothetical protein